MFRCAFRRRLLTLGVALMVALPWSAAASPEAGFAKRAAMTSSQPPALLSALWQRLTSLWAEIGCGLDPGGHCISGPNATGDPGGTQSQGDIGCGLDPDGHCISGPNAEDPRSTQSQNDIGCGLDPSGAPCLPYR